MGPVGYVQQKKDLCAQLMLQTRYPKNEILNPIVACDIRLNRVFGLKNECRHIKNKSIHDFYIISHY